MRVELKCGPAGDLTLAWLEAPGEWARPIPPAQIACIENLARTTAEAEGQRQLEPTAAARRELGGALFELLDGPEHALSHRLEQAALDGGGLALTIALRSHDMVWLAEHPAVGWRWELLADHRGPLTVRRELTLAVQLGDTRVPEPRALAHGGLRILFMAYSPRGVEPVLDYEDEEERVLASLAPFIEDGRARVAVVEFGSLEDLTCALLGHEFDVVHLSGHGVLGAAGPQLVMENRVGDADWVSPTRLLEVLQRAARMPKLVMIASCLSAGERDDIPSFTAQLVAGGVPTAIGWIQPIHDDLATEAAANIYQRLCTGHTPAQAVAFARARLFEADPAGSTRQAANAWGTLHLVTRDASGFFIDRCRPRPSAEPVDHRETYRNLDQQGRMRVLETGFVGRRRPLQRVLRVLLEGTEDGIRRAGVLIFGNKGTGKSCLAARAIQRVANGLEQPRELGVVVLHGELDGTQLFAQFEQQALRWDDVKAEALLRDSSRGSIVERLRRLLSGHWSRRRLVIVLDDFERNLETRTEGLARLSTLAAALLEVLLPACGTTKAKLLVTTTARFELPGREAEREPLVEIGLGGFSGSSLRKLWMRGQTGEAGAAGELSHCGPSDWVTLCDRLGRNPRILDWARALLRGKTSQEVDELAERLGKATPEWPAGEMPSAEREAELVRLFLCHMAYDEAIARVSEDARTFIRRARVYELAMPRDAFVGLCAGLEIDLDQHLPALQNLGLLEAGEFDREPAQRVSPLVEPVFAAEQAERWHGVAAEFWVEWKRHQGYLDRMLIGSRHALEAGHEDIARELSLLIRRLMDDAGLLHEALELAERHLERFPEEIWALGWVGYAQFRMGQPRAGWERFERGERLALEQGVSGRQLSYILDSGARMLQSLGRYSEAIERLERAAAIVEGLDGESLELSVLLHQLGGVCMQRGDLARARQCAERCLSIQAAILDTDEHRSVAASLQFLAVILLNQGDLHGAREHCERSVSIFTKLLGEDHFELATSHHTLGQIALGACEFPKALRHFERALAMFTESFGTDAHPDVAHVLQSLAGLLQSQGELGAARQCLTRAIEIYVEAFGTEIHHVVAAATDALAGVLLAQAETQAAHALYVRALAIFTQVFAPETHPDIAGCLKGMAAVLRAQGDLDGARQKLGRAIEIELEIYGTAEHPGVAHSYRSLADVLRAQGDLDGSREYLARAIATYAKVFGAKEHTFVAAAHHSMALTLLAQSDLVGAHQCIAEAIRIYTNIFATEEHTSVAACLDTRGRILHAEGNVIAAIDVVRRALSIEVTCHGSPHHLGCTQIELNLAMLLIEAEQVEEGMALLDHARRVLAEQVPDHPLLAAIEQPFQQVFETLGLPRSEDIAALALAARSGSLDASGHRIFAEGLDALSRVGSSMNTVATYLRIVATERVLPPVPSSIPDSLVEFLSAVRAAAQSC